MDMARRRIDLRLEEDFLARVDAEAERLGQTRTKFVERALERALEPRPNPMPSSPPPGFAIPEKSSRASMGRAAAFRAASQKGKS